MNVFLTLTLLFFIPLLAWLVFLALSSCLGTSFRRRINLNRTSSSAPFSSSGGGVTSRLSDMLTSLKPVGSGNAAPRAGNGAYGRTYARSGLMSSMSASGAGGDEMLEMEGMYSSRGDFEIEDDQ